MRAGILLAVRGASRVARGRRAAARRHAYPCAMSEPNGGGAARLVWITAPERELALALARRMVEGRLAACAQVLPGLASVYRWEGRVQEESEVLLLVKTTAARLPELEAWLRENHPYDTPECLAWAPARVEARYLAWLEEACADAPPQG